MSPDPIDRPDVARPDTGDIITPDLVVPDVTDPSDVLPDTGGTPTFNLTEAETLLLRRLLGTADPAPPRGAQTASGWPYALPADPLVEWPGVSQALANKLEATMPPSAWATNERTADDTAAANVIAVVAGGSVVNPASVPRPALIVGQMRYQQQGTAANLSISLRVGGVVVSKIDLGGAPQTAFDTSIHLHGVAAAVPPGVTTFRMEAVSSAGVLAVRPQSRVSIVLL